MVWWWCYGGSMCWVQGDPKMEFFSCRMERTRKHSREKWQWDLVIEWWSAFCSPLQQPDTKGMIPTIISFSCPKKMCNWEGMRDVGMSTDVLLALMTSPYEVQILIENIRIFYFSNICSMSIGDQMGNLEEKNLVKFLNYIISPRFSLQLFSFYIVPRWSCDYP